MSIDEYYLAFESILYGLIISRILIKWSEMFREEDSKTYHWAYLLLTLNVFFLIIYMFWVNRNPEHYAGINGPFDFFLTVVLPPSIFTFVTFQMFPSTFSGIVQKEYLLNNRRSIFIPWAFYLSYNVAVLSDNLLHPATFFTLLILVLTGLIFKFKRMLLVNIFLIIHSLMLLYVYMRILL